MSKKNVVLIKKRRTPLSETKRERIISFLRTFYMSALIIICIIGVFFLSVKVEEQSKQIGFGIYENAIDIYQDDTNYVMNFFSNKVEIPVEKTKETIDSATDFVACLTPPIIRVIFQSVTLLIT